MQVSATLRGGSALTGRREPIDADILARFLQPPPRSVGALNAPLVFDLSGSMEGKPLEEAKVGARAFVARIDLTRSAIGVAGVANRVAIYLDPSRSTEAILKAINRLVTSSLGGNMAHPFDVIGKALVHSAGGPVMIVLADGGWIHMEGAIAAAKALHARGITIVAVGFGCAERSILDGIASTEEEALLTNLGELVETFESIAELPTEGGLERGVRK